MKFNTEELLNYTKKSSPDHINSHDVLEFIPFFYKIKTYLEVGIGRGGSVKHVLKNFKGSEITCVDIMPWNEDILLNQLYKDRTICLLTELPEFNMSHCGGEFFELERSLEGITFYVLQAFSHQFLQKAIELEKKFDLIYVDGDHSYETSKLDIEYGLQCLNSPGFLLLDDINPNPFFPPNPISPEGNFGCSKSYFEIKEKNEDKNLSFMEFGINFNIKTTDLPRELYSTGVGLICKT